MPIHLTWPQMSTTFAVMLITSKGVAGVSGSTFVTLAATLATVETVPVAGMALLLGIERFMSIGQGDDQHDRERRRLRGHRRLGRGP